MSKNVMKKKYSLQRKQRIKIYNKENIGRITGKLTKTGIGNRRFGIQKNANKKKYLK